MVKSKFLAEKKKKSVLSKITDFFAKSQYHAYLVGGYVRDLSLNRNPVDIDIVVEGDAIEAAKQLNLKLNGKLCVHKEFGTASIVTKKERIDLASARLEKYPAPAQLPHVYPSTIIDDLNRRDFTINAMAMSISKTNFGEIFDPFNGLVDIKNGLIRALHKNSFVDDPTRIFRALRYKNRFGFKLEPETKIFIKEAIARGMIKELSGQRILNELRLIFAEPAFQKTVEDLSGLRIFSIANKDVDLLTMLGSYRIYYYLAKLDNDKLPLTKDEKKLTDDFSKIEKTTAQLRKATKSSAIYNLLSPIDDQIVDLLPMVHSDVTSKIMLYLKLRKTIPFIRGSDLQNLGFKPGKNFKGLLKKLYDLQLDKKINSKQSAIKFLKRR